jgi:hypothetical protein
VAAAYHLSRAPPASSPIDAEPAVHPDASMSISRSSPAKSLACALAALVLAGCGDLFSLDGDPELCRCRDRIPPMTLCWVMEVDSYVLLDETCYRLAFGDAAAGRDVAES